MPESFTGYRTGCGTIHVTDSRGVEYLVEFLKTEAAYGLNSESEFRYPSVFDNREARGLSGREKGILKVVHDKERPFIVRTEKVGHPRISGTEFNVPIYTGKAVGTDAGEKGSGGSKR